jgi:hypothetical protein
MSVDMRSKPAQVVTADQLLGNVARRVEQGARVDGAYSLIFKMT